MILKCNDVVIRTFTKNHPEIEKIIEETTVSRFLTEKWLYPEPMPDTITFGIESNGEIIGEVALKSIRWYNRKAELSLFIKPDFQGRKIGPDVLVNVMKYAFHTLNFHRLEAEIIDYNDRSLKLVESLNFKMEGRLRQAKYYEGKYYDILRYGILKTEFETFIGNSKIG
jgi:RimJ/RimL family protein N-acetyltransferase